MSVRKGERGGFGPLLGARIKFSQSAYVHSEFLDRFPARMESIHLLTSGLIDYAGLFPPAELGMGEAVRNYAEYLEGPDSGMLGRFVLPASRISEFEETAAAFLPKSAGSNPWKLAVLLSGNFEEEISALLKFNCSHWSESPAGHAVVDVVEVKASNPEAVAKLKASLPDFYTAFIEIPPDATAEMFAGIREARFSAKIRTGGIEEAAFPAATAIVTFMQACKREGVAFKATAGLHHIVCSRYPLTYAPESASAPMFGFLNVFAAAVSLFAGGSSADTQAMLEERDVGAFTFDRHGLSWWGRSLSNADIKKAREGFAVSFGSCSFTEPVEELARLLKTSTSY